MKKTPSTIIGVKKAFTRNFQDHPVTFMLDATDNVWLFGQQVCPIIRYKHVYNTITRYCPLCRLLKPKEVKGFDIPIKVSNRGAMIFPVNDLPGLLAISKNTTFKEKGLAWVQEQVAQLTDTPATAQPPARVEPPPSDERWFKEVGTYEFEGVVFTGLMDERIMPGNKKKIPGFIAQEITDQLEYEYQHDSTRYLPQNTKGWFNKRTPGGLQKVRVVDERGFYQLITRAKRTPFTERFQAWVFFDVLPTIRETGEYRPKPQVEAPQFDPHEMIKHPENLQRLLLESIAATQNAQILIAAKDEVIEKKDRMIDYKDNRYREATHQLIRAEKKSKQFERYAKLFLSVRASDGTSTITAIGKMFQIRRKLLIEYMSSKDKGPKKWLYRTEKDKRKKKGPWLPMDWTIKKGYLFYNVAEYGDEEKGGTEPQARVTENGWRALLSLIQDNPYYETPEGIRVKLLTYQEENQIATHIDNNQLNLFDENGDDIHRTD